MNYYSHHIGDFNNATRHLSRLERSIYRDLIEYCYDTEQPIPADLSIICRKILATTKEERTVVVRMLKEFFVLSKDKGWTNKRCEIEIKKYQEKKDKQIEAGKASARARAKANKNNDNNPTDVEQALNGCSTDAEQTLNQPRTKNQEPITKNHKPETNNHLRDKYIYSPTAEKIKEVIDYLNLKTGSKYKPSSKSTIKFIGSRLKEYSIADCKKVIDVKTAEWADTPQSKYLRPETLFNEAKFEGYINQPIFKKPSEVPKNDDLRRFAERHNLIGEKRLTDGN